MVGLLLRGSASLMPLTPKQPTKLFSTWRFPACSLRKFRRRLFARISVSTRWCASLVRWDHCPSWLGSHLGAKDPGPKSQGTFLHSSFHGNIGYMSYAIAYYALGESHFARIAIIGSFLMLAQNILAVWALCQLQQQSSSQQSEMGVREAHFPESHYPDGCCSHRLFSIGSSFAPSR